MFRREREEITTVVSNLSIEKKEKANVKPK